LDSCAVVASKWIPLLIVIEPRSTRQNPPLQWLWPHLRQAPCVELFDGLRTFEQFCEAVPEGYAGVLDLSMCNSVMVAEELKRQRKQALIVENVFLATPEFRLARFALVIKQLATRPMRYTDAVVRVHRALLELKQ
jgi:hypothetical protein